jgi:hypothetical protein
MFTPKLEMNNTTLMEIINRLVGQFKFENIKMATVKL